MLHNFPISPMFIFRPGLVERSLYNLLFTGFFHNA